MVNANTTPTLTHERAAENYRRNVIQFHERREKWKPTHYEHRAPLAIVSDDDGRSAIYAGDLGHVAFVAASLPPETIEAVQELQRLRRILGQVQNEILRSQTDLATRLLDLGLTLREAAPALELTQGRISQLVGPGKTRRKPVRPARVRP